MTVKRIHEVYSSKPRSIEREGLPEGVLARIVGPFAEYNTVNRNNRYYDKSVWEAAINLPEVVECLEAKTFFGEDDHPTEEDRVESTVRNTCLNVTELWLEDDPDGSGRGCVYGKADILDTPSGRVIERLLAYGSKLGISARAWGDSEVRSDGVENILSEGFVLSALIS